MVDDIADRVRRATLEDAEAIRRSLDSVARERRWLSFLEAPSLADVRSFISLNVPIQFVAEREGEVIGWCDITPNQREGFRLNGTLGMGLLSPFRGRGLGRKLLQDTTDAAHGAGIRRIELEVLASNENAVALYERSGFVHEGRKRAARVLDGRAEDILCMALLWPPERAV